MTPTPDSDDIERTTLRLPRDLLEFARERAEHLDRSLNYILVEAIRREVTMPVHSEREDLEIPGPDGEPPSVQVMRRHQTAETGVWTCDLWVEGKQVPYIEVCEFPPGAPGGLPVPSYTISLDNRYGTSAMTYEELWKQAWFWANAMAVAAGYTSHGPNARRINRHGEPEPIATNIAEGWEHMERSGCLGSCYEMTFTYNLPAMADADQWAYDTRNEIRDRLRELGARETVSRIIHIGGMMAETREEPIRECQPGDSSDLCEWPRAIDCPVHSVLERSA
jgi:hypothetical protein